MSAFTDWSGRMVREPGTRFFTATDDLRWAVGKEGSGFVATVPASFRHDVSVPWALCWAFDPLDPQYQKFARIHDWLLNIGWSRVEAGATAHQALVTDKVAAWRRLAMLLAVIVWKYR